ncbi:hypothetical protein [Nitrosomonas communis]|uniref:Uncharacterized protein n=1 Tax=Nitrosomonas communis TaxID=44574 RepID=A0A1I4V272_9PROT|nr:hypothetical protein [Nitrosomonas communis]SFM95347.1 hypothetical protein SAMN05421863_10753 [Nitrosomonas communis]
MKLDYSSFKGLEGKIFSFFFFMVVLCFPFQVHSSETYKKIVEGMEPQSITIIGESQQLPESIQFFQGLISSYLQQGKCLAVALEIVSIQQTILDQMVEGRTIKSDIKLPPMIEHTSYRSLVDDLVIMKRRGHCLRLIAIDAGGLNVNQDKWMAERLAKQISQAPILALLGNLHTLKKIGWNSSIGKAFPYVAEILSSQGYRIKTYPQIRQDKACNTQNRLISSDEQKIATLLNRSVISLLNAAKYETVNNVVDGVILWECG